MSRMTPEGKVKAHLKALYRSLEPAVMLTQPLGTVFNAAGVHDHILCVRGRFVSVEVKAGKNRLSPAQMHYGGRVARAGGLAVMVNEENIAWFETVLRMMCEQPELDHHEPGFDETFEHCERTFP